MLNCPIYVFGRLFFCFKYSFSNNTISNIKTQIRRQQFFRKKKLLAERYQQLFIFIFGASFIRFEWQYR